MDAKGSCFLLFFLAAFETVVEAEGSYYLPAIILLIFFDFLKILLFWDGIMFSFLLMQTFKGPVGWGVEYADCIPTEE